MKKFRQCLIGSALLMAVIPSAFSAPLIQAPLPSNAYITKNGYEWAWVFAVAPDGSYAGFLPDFSYQSTLGWRLPTTAELALAPSPLDFLFTGANVPLGGGDPISGAWFAYPTAALTGAAACAAGYFVDRDGYNHCDWGNAPGTGDYFDGSNWVDLSLPWWGQTGAQAWSETLAIRDIPEPSGLALIATALMGLGALRYRKVR